MSVAAALERLAALPRGPEAVDEARGACTQLRWHPALRRRAAAFPPDASGRAALGVLRAHAEAEVLAPGWEQAPLQVLARLHVVAAAGLVPDAALGRPRQPGEDPGDGADLLTAGGAPLPV